MSLYPHEFRPRATKDLVRVGARYDGGYVIPERLIAVTRGLLSFGLNDEWEFERQFAEKSNAKVVCFDPSVDRMFWVRKFAAGLGKGVLQLDAGRMRRGLRFIDYARFFDGLKHVHVPRPIGNGVGAVPLAQALELAKLAEPIFLKMDIEGWEYRILDEVVRERRRFSGMAIEFHDVDLHEDRISAFIKAVDDSQILVHFHANSHTAVGPGGSALVVEMSFMSRTLLTTGENPAYIPLPLQGLDAPNLPHNQEAVVKFRESA